LIIKRGERLVYKGEDQEIKELVDWDIFGQVRPDKYRKVVD